MLSISVVTPSLNQGQFIAATIRSVLDQAYPNCEYLVVDGGSTDATLEVLRQFEGRLRWISEPDHGQADAVNKGILLTSGEVIGWLNSDDMYCAGALEAVGTFMQAHPDVDVVYGQADVIDEHGQVVGPCKTERWDAARLHQTCFLSQPAVFFRRRVVQRFGLLDSSLQYCMDYEFWLRLAHGGARFDYLCRRLAGSRMYPTNKTLGQRPLVHDEINRMLRAHLGRVPDSWLANDAHTRLELRGWSPDRTPLQFGVGCAILYCWLAWRWNRSMSAHMLNRSIRRVGSGVMRAASSAFQ